MRLHSSWPVLLLTSLCATVAAVAQADTQSESSSVVKHLGPQIPNASSKPAPNAYTGVFADETDRKPSGWIQSWLHAVDTARANQPHFTAPIVTTHVMLVQQYRYDMSWQQDSPGHATTSNFGASRGLEIIPTTRLELGISPPAYHTHETSKKDGLGDLAWQVKFRAFSAPKHKGDYFVGAFLGGTLSTGGPPNGSGHGTLSPTCAAAKGVGKWDIQSTVGANLPISGTETLGRTVIFNTAVNYRIRGIVWPMLEQNSIFWFGGSNDGKKQTFLTPGLILGSFPISERLRIAVGGGLQVAITPYHQYNHRWIVSVRFPF